ncbi:hypothetical protein DPMN_123899 [Dreissena polymorpha]|uniref:Uncharacterized protein n=1 Tax=Dreissena polymorpha TaxID=45954 RepID=A0A9D4GRS3_DREPO|nr:hypothetical protein DPMN_123899 [Dreissena polymorpha]
MRHRKCRTVPYRSDSEAYREPYRGETITIYHPTEYRDTLSLTTCSDTSTDPRPREIQASRYEAIPVLIHTRERYEPHDMQLFQY